MRRQEALVTPRVTFPPATAKEPLRNRNARRKLLRQLARVFDGDHAPFGTLEGTEKMTPKTLRTTLVAGNVFEMIEFELRDLGHQVDGTLGAIMAAVPMNKYEVHYLSCNCHSGIRIPSWMVAGRLRGIAANRQWRYLGRRGPRRRS